MLHHSQGVGTLVLQGIRRQTRQGVPVLVSIGSILSLAAVSALLFGSTVRAQPIEAPVYTIRAGDTLNISVAGHEEWSLSVTVRPDGRITYPATGEIEVADLTIQQVTEKLEHALGPGGRHLRDPKVFINVTGLRAPTAYILGAVAKPGPVELARGVSRATKVLTMASGVTPEGDLTRVTIYRDDGTRERIDLQAELDGDVEQTLIHGGDVLVVPETEVRFVGVLGATATAGEIPLAPEQQSIDMLELLVQIGGVSEGADRDRAMILRADGPIETVALDSVLNREIEAPILHGGDVLWIPPEPPEPEPEYFAVTGAVESAGQFEYREGITLADALALAGQPSDAANPEEVTIIHADGEKEIIDILPMMHGQDTEIARKPIQPEDIVLVPARDKSYVMLGAVGDAGFFPWDEETRLADALARAGGPTPDAAVQRVVLVRRSEEGGSPTVLQLDARKLLQGENEAANWKLMPGDTVYVPRREERGIRQTLSEPLAVLGIIGALERIFEW